MQLLAPSGSSLQPSHTYSLSATARSPHLSGAPNRIVSGFKTMCKRTGQPACGSPRLKQDPSRTAIHGNSGEMMRPSFLRQVPLLLCFAVYFVYLSRSMFRSTCRPRWSGSRTPGQRRQERTNRTADGGRIRSSAWRFLAHPIEAPPKYTGHHPAQRRHAHSDEKHSSGGGSRWGQEEEHVNIIKKIHLSEAPPLCEVQANLALFIEKR